MNCKNCGARMSDNAKVCPNCGAMTDENEGYVLLTDNDTEYEDYYSTDKKPKKKKGGGIKWFLSILLTLAIVGGGAYYYFEYIYDKPTEAPAVTFEGGTGIINGDEQILYVTIKDNTSIEYIHGVTLCDLTSSDSTKTNITDKYQYTKSINDTFRAIFFDTKELELKDNVPYSFEMKFSFSGDDTVYTYTETVKYAKDADTDVSDVIFDHSVEGESTTAAEVTESTTKAEETTTTATANADDAAFIGESYWFGEPEKNGDEYTIYCYKFNDDGKYTATKYYKNGSKDWEITSSGGTYELSAYSLSFGGEEYLIDGENKALESDTGKKLTSRKFNSVKNAEDFFGI